MVHYSNDMAVVFRVSISVLESLSHTRQEAKKSKGKRGGYSKHLEESSAWSSFVKSSQNESQQGYHPKMRNLVDIWLEFWDF